MMWKRARRCSQGFQWDTGIPPRQDEDSVLVKGCAYPNEKMEEIQVITDLVNDGQRVERHPAQMLGQAVHDNLEFVQVAETFDL